MRAGDFTTAWGISDGLLRDLLARGFVQRGPIWERSVWRGEPVAGRRVLIRCHHGLGDTIQFIRYAPILRNVASELIVQAQPELVELLSTVDGIDRFVAPEEETEFDLDLEVMELPYVFRTILDTIPAAVPYLRVDPARLDGRRRELPGGRMNIGVAWLVNSWDRLRSVPTQELHTLAGIRALPAAAGRQPLGWAGPHLQVLSAGVDAHDRRYRGHYSGARPGHYRRYDGRPSCRRPRRAGVDHPAPRSGLAMARPSP
jgi:hypothetical protein